MGKRRRRGRYQRKARPKHPLGLELKAINNPFADIPLDDLPRLLAKIGREQAQQFTVTTEALKELISRADRLGLLACLVAYGLTDFIDNSGLVSSKKSRLEPAHVELAIMLCLTHEPVTRTPDLALTEHVGSMFEMLPQWTNQFHWKRLAQVERATSDMDKRRLAVQEQMRTTTQMVRNWGFYDQVRRIGIEMLSPLDARFEAVNGYRLTDLIAVFDYMFGDCQRRLNEHLDKLKPMFAAKTVRDAVQAYFEEVPYLEGTPEALERLMRDRHASVMTAKTILMSHADLRLADCYTFTAQQVASAIARAEIAVDKALKELSYQFGDLKDANIEYAFMNNPIWTKPVVDLGEGGYFCPMPQTFFAFLFETVLALVRNNTSLRNLYDKRRSDYLEDKTAELFNSAFPNSTLTRNFKWQTPDKTQEFESDLIAGLDSAVILVEAKSGRVSPEARRGAEESLRENVNSLLIEPSRQSKRLEDALIAARSGVPGTTAFREAFPIKLDRIQQVIRLSVTLDDIGFIHTNINALKDIGYVPPDINVAPAFTLADLEIAFDILQSPLERLHYFFRRGVWEGKADYTADEIDLLGVYLNTGLNVGDIHKGARLVLLGQSKPIDEYYESQRHGINRIKPSYKATQWWRDILRRLEGKKPDRWIEAGITLLSAGYGQQVEMERRMKSLVATVKRERERAAAHNGLIFFASTDASEAVVILALMGTQMAERFRLMKNLASHAFSENVDLVQCVVIAINVDDPIYPYSALATFTRPREATA